MNNQNTDTNAQSKKWRSWLILFLRWLLGGIAGVWISSWFYFGLKNHASTGSFLWFGELLESVLAIPFVGHIYLFYPDTISYTNVNDFLMLCCKHRLNMVNKKDEPTRKPLCQGRQNCSSPNDASTPEIFSRQKSTSL